MTLILQGTDNSVSSPAVQGGTAGTTTGVYYPASNVVALVANGAEGLRLDSSGSVCIGNSGNFGAKTNITFDPSSTNGLLLAVSSGTFTNNYIYFQNSGGNKIGFVSSDNSTVAYNTSSSGQTNGAVLKNSGVAFPATQVPSADANTLDDYEEGTWTPTFTNCGTVTLNFAKYTRIGRIINYQMSFASTSLTANSSRWTTAFSADNITSGTYSSGTVLGGIVEQQTGTSCYMATTPSSTAATFYINWTALAT